MSNAEGTSIATPAEMAMFDALPKPVRECLHDLPIKYGAHQCYRRGYDPDEIVIFTNEQIRTAMTSGWEHGTARKWGAGHPQADSKCPWSYTLQPLRGAARSKREQRRFERMNKLRERRYA